MVAGTDDYSFFLFLEHHHGVRLGGSLLTTPVTPGHFHTQVAKSLPDGLFYMHQLNGSAFPNP